MEVKISAVIITLNEEENISRCLESLQDVADEIIVVDSYSTDLTVILCERYGAQVFQRDWQGYSNAKNFANTQARFPLIFSVDADEVVSKKLKKSILKLKLNHLSGMAYTMNRLTNYCGTWIKHCGWYPDKKLRIWENGAGIWEGEIHEKVVFKNQPKMRHIKGDLLHYSYHTIDQHYKQAERFTTLTARSDFKQGKKASLIKLIFAPIIKFFKAYILQSGYLDGVAGFTVCRISAYASFLKYKKLRQLWKEKG